MKILKIIGIVLIAIVVVIGVVVAFQPSHGHVEKTIVIKASPSAVFAQINSLKSMNAWSPWAKMDPGANYTYEGAEAGVGAKMRWDGTKTGKGSQWIEVSEENKRVKNGLSFEGFNGTAYAEFVLTPEGEGTRVTWMYDGNNAGVGGKAMWLFMKGALQTQYGQGLIDLKKMVESNPTPSEIKADSTATK